MIVRARIKLYSSTSEFTGVALVDTGATHTIMDYSLAEHLNLKPFGEREVVTLGTKVQCQLVDVKGMVIEEVEIGPRRLFVCNFPRDVKKKLKSMKCSDKIIIGIPEVESAGYIPNTIKGKLEKVGFIVFNHFSE